jgi:hypothetical protein
MLPDFAIERAARYAKPSGRSFYSSAFDGQRSLNVFPFHLLERQNY